MRDSERRQERRRPPSQSRRESGRFVLPLRLVPFIPPSNSYHFALDEPTAQVLSWGHVLRAALELRLLVLLRPSLDGPWMETHARLRQRQLTACETPTARGIPRAVFRWRTSSIRPVSRHDHHHPPRHLR